jgi:hypothetical protein
MIKYELTQERLREIPPPAEPIVLRRYGALTIVGFRDAKTAKVAIVRCSCGNIVERSVEALVGGEILNCGNCRATPATPAADSFAGAIAGTESRSAWKRHKGGGGA